MFESFYYALDTDQEVILTGKRVSEPFRSPARFELDTPSATLIGEACVDVLFVENVEDSETE